MSVSQWGRSLLLCCGLGGGVLGDVCERTANTVCLVVSIRRLCRTSNPFNVIEEVKLLVARVLFDPLDRDPSMQQAALAIALSAESPCINVVFPFVRALIVTHRTDTNASLGVVAAPSLDLENLALRQ